ncbi:hypothetical protein GY15_02220 [Delftia sp. 670]|nr:hypothetical protein GY15_02220 [Delftia sp. 670]
MLAHQAPGQAGAGAGDEVVAGGPDEAHLGDLLEGQAAARRWPGDDHAVQLAIDDALLQHLADVGVGLQLQVGVQLGHLLHQPGQPGQAAEFAKADAAAALQAHAAARRLAQLGGAVQQLADARQQLLALGREFGGAAAAVEQLHAQRSLQLRNALGQR